MAARPYKRLPGRSRQLFLVASLWEAEDHLLYVQSYGVTESYRRFYHRDIRSIIISETKTGLIMSIVLAVMGLAFGVCAVFAYSEIAVAISLAIIGGFFFLLAAINALFGPTCRCTLSTAVQTQPLLSLGRLRTARKVLARIQAGIAAAQTGA